MNIDRYYRETAKINLNSSVAALFPAIIIVIANVLFLKQDKIMLFSIPFIFYSFVLFQLHIRRLNQAVSIKRELKKFKKGSLSIFTARQLLVFFQNTTVPRLFLFFPNGSLAGSIHAVKGKGYFYTLMNAENEIIGFYKVIKNSYYSIEVYDKDHNYLGSLIKKQLGSLLKKEVVDASGEYVGSVEGSRMFMDEHMLDKHDHVVGRLRQGYMPLEWDSLFPDANTPIFSIKRCLSKEGTLLQFSLLINEYFIERF